MDQITLRKTEIWINLFRASMWVAGFILILLFLSDTTSLEVFVALIVLDTIFAKLINYNLSLTLLQYLPEHKYVKLDCSNAEIIIDKYDFKMPLITTRSIDDIMFNLTLLKVMKGEENDNWSLKVSQN